MATAEKMIIIRNRQGLHARPAALFVQTANKFDSDISVEKDGEVVNGKSIMGIMMLAAEKDSKVKISAKGSDAKQAVDELAALLIGDIEEPDILASK